MNVNQITKSAYQFEIASIESNSTEANPYYDTIMQMENGETLWEAVNMMVESYVSYHEQYDELEQFADRVCKANEHMKDVIERQAEEISDLKQQLFDGEDNPLDDIPF